MAKTANFNIRIDPKTKLSAERLFSQFGITVTDAVNIFLHQSLMVGGLPFELKQPHYNAETEDAIKEAREIMAGRIEAKAYRSAGELSKELDEEISPEI